MLNVVDKRAGPSGSRRTLKGSDWTASVPFLQRSVETWAFNNTFGGIPNE